MYMCTIIFTCMYVHVVNKQNICLAFVNRTYYKIHVHVHVDVHVLVVLYMCYGMLLFIFNDCILNILRRIYNMTPGQDTVNF